MRNICTSLSSVSRQKAFSAQLAQNEERTQQSKAYGSVFEAKISTHLPWAHKGHESHHAILGLGLKEPRSGSGKHLDVCIVIERHPGTIDLVVHVSYVSPVGVPKTKLHIHVQQWCNQMRYSCPSAVSIYRNKFVSHIVPIQPKRETNG